MRKTHEYLQNKKRRGEKITVLTAYDYPTARWEDEVGVDVIHVGDSVGTNMLGYSSEREVTMEDMVHHTAAVNRAARNAYVSADLPYKSYETPEQALENSLRLIEVGADGVKPEGTCFEIVRHLTANGVEVWGHLGYNPQIHDKAAFQAKTADAAAQLVKDCVALEEAGAKYIVLEMVPEEVAGIITQKLSIPTIGIGAGRFTDGQVLVITDVLGINSFDLRHSVKYARFYEQGIDAIRRYVNDVQTGGFPGEDNVRHLKPEELQAFQDLIG